MKKKILCVLLCFGCWGCTSSNSNPYLNASRVYKIEKMAKLTILMDDEAYANEVQTLWNHTYPAYKDRLHIDVEPYQANKNVTYDIQWRKDSDITDTSQFLKIEELENVMNIPEHLRKDEKYFVPIEGKGLVFVYHKKRLQESMPDMQSIASFEQIANFSHHVYYHNRKPEYVYPFLFTSHEEDSQEWMKEGSFYENIVAYRQLNKLLSFYDDPYNTLFYEDDSYLCGLVMNDGTYKNSTAYQKGYLSFSKMPTYQGKQYSPIVDTYGFVVNKHVKYPAAAHAFLQLVRSEKGIDILLKNTSKTPLIASEDLKKLNLFDSNRKEIIQAMNDSQLRDVKLEKLLEKNDAYSILQNSLYTQDSDKSIWKRLTN